MLKSDEAGFFEKMLVFGFLGISCPNWPENEFFRQLSVLKWSFGVQICMGGKNMCFKDFLTKMVPNGQILNMIV